MSISPTKGAKGDAANNNASTDGSEILLDKEQVLLSFDTINWDNYSRTLLTAEEVRGKKKEYIDRYLK